MNIAIIGSGNVGGALAQNWARAGHHICLGVRDLDNFNGRELLEFDRIVAKSSPEAAKDAEVVVLAVPAQVITNVVQELGDLGGKVLIDATNALFHKPEGFTHAFDALKFLAPGSDLVKCFNTTGYENMLDPFYHGEGIDMFMAGDSARAKDMARQLAKDAGFGVCWDFGGGDKVALLEQFAAAWINLAIMQGYGRDIAFKLIRR